MKSWIHILVSHGESVELTPFHYAINAEKALVKEKQKNLNCYLITKTVVDHEEYVSDLEKDNAI